MVAINNSKSNIPFTWFSWNVPSSENYLVTLSWQLSSFLATEQRAPFQQQMCKEARSGTSLILNIATNLLQICLSSTFWKVNNHFLNMWIQIKHKNHTSRWQRSEWGWGGKRGGSSRSEWEQRDRSNRVRFFALWSCGNDYFSHRRSRKLAHSTSAYKCRYVAKKGPSCKTQSPEQTERKSSLLCYQEIKYFIQKYSEYRVGKKR